MCGHAHVFSLRWNKIAPSLDTLGGKTGWREGASVVLRSFSTCNYTASASGLGEKRKWQATLCWVLKLFSWVLSAQFNHLCSYSLYWTRHSSSYLSLTPLWLCLPSYFKPVCKSPRCAALIAGTTALCRLQLHTGSVEPLPSQGGGAGLGNGRVLATVGSACQEQGGDGVGVGETWQGWLKPRASRSFQGLKCCPRD